MWSRVRLLRFASTASAAPSSAAAGDSMAIRPAVLSGGFYRGMLGFWGFWAAFVAQHQYFTRVDEQTGQRRLHPITRWILYNRRTERERQQLFEELLEDGHRQAELNVFYTAELHRPVKDPRFDPRILTQKDWSQPPAAQDMHHVDLTNIKWRKGYGEDADAVERLEEQKRGGK